MHDIYAEYFVHVCDLKGKFHLLKLYSTHRGWRSKELREVIVDGKHSPVSNTC